MLGRKKIRELFNAPTFPGNLKRSSMAARAFSLIMGLLVSAALWFLLVPLLTGIQIQRDITAFSFFLMALVMLTLLKSGHIEIASGLLVGFLWLILGFAMITGEGTREPAYLGFSLVILASGILFGKKSAFIVAIVSILAGIITIYLGETGLIVPMRIPGSLWAYFIGSSLILLLLASMMSIGIASPAKTEELILSEVNKRLEAQASQLRSEENLSIALASKKRLENAMTNVTRGIDSETGISFLKNLTIQLTKVLSVDLAFIGESTEDLYSIQSLAWVHDGIEKEPILYNIKDAPGIETLLKKPSVYIEGISQKFPNDPVFGKTHAEGYVSLPLLDSQGACLGLIFIVSYNKITDLPFFENILHVFGARAGAEIERLRYERRLQSLNADLEKKVDARTSQLQLAIKELESFSYSVSHDLRGPLRAVMGFGQLLSEEYSEILEDKGQKYIERIQTATLGMSQLIEDILLLSKISRSPLDATEIDLSEIAKEVIQELQELDSTRNIEWKVQPGLLAKCDPKLIRIALENLLRNSYKFTKGNEIAKITFSGNEEQGKTVFVISDNGIGFDMKYIEKLFQPFQRLHSDVEFEGTGIGLATVHRVIQRHGGKVWAEAEPEKGSQFFFTIAG